MMALSGSAANVRRPAKICIVQLGRIGDLLLITPLFAALKAAYPDSELHLLAGNNNCIVVQGNPHIDRIHVHTKRPLGTIRLLATLLGTRFDVWLDPKEHKSTESSMFARLARAAMKIGFEGDKVFTHPSCRQEEGGEHYTRRSLRNLHYLGIDGASPKPVAGQSPVEDAAFEAFRVSRGVSRYYAVNISANRPERYWNDDRWAELLSSMPASCGAAVFLCEPNLLPRVQAIAGRVVGSHVFQTQSILGTFPVVKKACLVLTVETSIVHVAAAFNAPVVGLYLNQPEFYVQYMPLSDAYRVVLPRSLGMSVADVGVADVRKAVCSLMAECGIAGDLGGENLPGTVLRNKR